MVLASLIACLACAPARAQAPAGGTPPVAPANPPADPAPIPPNEGRGLVLAPRSGAGADSVLRIAPRPARRFDAPRWVMLRSLAFPGWGQATNGAWIKAILIGGTEIALGAGALADARALPRLDREVQAARTSADNATLTDAITRYNQRLDRMVSREWMLGGLIAYALVDAYVDAHFRNFKIEFERDPALPQGAPGPSGVRASLRWTF